MKSGLQKWIDGETCGICSGPPTYKYIGPSVAVNRFEHYACCKHIRTIDPDLQHWEKVKSSDQITAVKL